MRESFWDDVARAFGGYGSGATYASAFPNGNPEQRFREILHDLSDPSRVALDVGCADGRFTLSIAAMFRQIVAIDSSPEMLSVARRLQREAGVSNVAFEGRDAFDSQLDSASFDVVYNRRGPDSHAEVYRVLKPDGVLVLMTIGERDCRAIKEVFGRGQDFEDWHVSRLDAERDVLSKLGFDVVEARDYEYAEFYASTRDLQLLLRSTPILGGFEPPQDEGLLDQYVAAWTTERGIRLDRHRVVISARKSDQRWHRP